MKSIFELVTAPAIATYWTEVNSNSIPYLGEALFPADKKLGLDLSWIKGYKGLPVALKPSNFDAKATVRDRIAVNKVDTEMPFFRESMTIKEKDRQELLKLQSANAAYYQMVLKQIFDDAGTLIDGAMVQPERMRMGLLLGGKIDINAERVDYTYDFDIDGSYASNNTLTLTGTDMWSDHDSSNPIEDLQEMMNEAGDAGTTITRAVMTRKTWAHLMQNKAIKMDMNVLSGDRIILTDSMLDQYLVGKLGLKVVIYNKKYKDESGADQNFFPDGYVSLLPDGALGKTWYGTTPEEADLMSGAENALVSIVSTGVAVTTYKEVHPVNVVTMVSEVVLPSFERMDATRLLKVF